MKIWQALRNMLTQSTEDGGGVHVGPGTAVSSLAVAGCLLHGCGDLVFFGTTSIQFITASAPATHFTISQWQLVQFRKSASMSTDQNVDNPSSLYSAWSMLLQSWLISHYAVAGTPGPDLWLAPYIKHWVKAKAKQKANDVSGPWKCLNTCFM